MRYEFAKCCDIAFINHSFCVPLQRGWTALHFAAQYKQYECALLCIEHGADATVLERVSVLWFSTHVIIYDM